MTITWLHTVKVAGVVVDPCKVALPLTTTHGRSSSATQPDAPTCQFDWLGPTPPGQLGDDLEVTVDLPAGAAVSWLDPAASWLDPAASWMGNPAQTVQRFTGRITQQVATEKDGQVIAWRIDSIGTQAQHAVAPVQVSRPQETDIARVQAIATAAGATITIHGTSTLQLAADNIDRDALSAWHEVCESSAGLIWQSPDGTLNYGTANHRERNPVGVLPCTAILDGLDWTQQVEQIVNHVTVKWGVEGASQTTVSDPASITKWRRRHVEVSTILASEADANGLGGVILARRAQPYWAMPGVLVLPDSITRADQALIAALDVGSIVWLPIDEVPGPTPAPATAWVVEGWVEERGASKTTIQLALVDAARWVQTRVRVWDDARKVTWASEALGTWLDALTWEIGEVA